MERCQSWTTWGPCQHHHWHKICPVCIPDLPGLHSRVQTRLQHCCVSPAARVHLDHPCRSQQTRQPVDQIECVLQAIVLCPQPAWGHCLPSGRRTATRRHRCQWTWASPPVLTWRGVPSKQASHFRVVQSPRARVTTVHMTGSRSSSIALQKAELFVGRTATPLPCGSAWTARRQAQTTLRYGEKKLRNSWPTQRMRTLASMPPGGAWPAGTGTGGTCGQRCPHVPPPSLLAATERGCSAHAAGREGPRCQTGVPPGTTQRQRQAGRQNGGPLSSQLVRQSWHCGLVGPCAAGLFAQLQRLGWLHEPPACHHRQRRRRQLGRQRRRRRSILNPKTAARGAAAGCAWLRVATPCAGLPARSRCRRTGCTRAPSGACPARRAPRRCGACAARKPSVACA